MRRGVGALLLAVLLLAGDLRAAEEPLWGRGPDGTVSVSSLPNVLSRPEVRPHLTTGLTTGFVVKLDARVAGGRKIRGAARVDIRWEPWDEVFFTAVVDGDGRVRRETIGSFEGLVAWWRGLELAMAPRIAAEPSAVQVELSVVPFSQSEQLDAQRWFSGALAPETAGDLPTASPAESRLNGVVDLLIATSIQRRSIVRYQWPARARPASRPDR